MGATGENFEHICEIEKRARSARVLSVMEAQHSHIFSYIFLISGNWSSATLAGKIKNIVKIVVLECLAHLSPPPSHLARS